MNKGKQLIAGLLLFAFISLISLAAMFFMAEPKEYSEPFITKKVTRVSDCNCLPGYIPSNMKSKYDDGKIYQYPIINDDETITNEFYFVMKDSIRRIDLNNPCGFPLTKSDETIKKFKYKDLRKYNNFNKYVNSIQGGSVGVIDCSYFNKTEKLDSYFCQNLSNPTDKSTCY